MKVVVGLNSHNVTNLYLDFISCYVILYHDSIDSPWDGDHHADRWLACIQSFSRKSSITDICLGFPYASDASGVFIVDFE